jgi:hypothetical protein
MWQLLPGSVSDSLSGSGPGMLPGSGPGVLPRSGSCDLVSGPGSCDLVSGSGSCSVLSGPGSGSVLSGPGSGSVLSDSVKMSRQDMGFQKRSFTATSNLGEYVTHILSCFPCGCLAPGVVAGAGLANKLLEIKRLDKPEAI